MKKVLETIGLAIVIIIVMMTFVSFAGMLVTDLWDIFFSVHGTRLPINTVFIKCFAFGLPVTVLAYFIYRHENMNDHTGSC